MHRQNMPASSGNGYIIRDHAHNLDAFSDHLTTRHHLQNHSQAYISSPSSPPQPPHWMALDTPMPHFQGQPATPLSTQLTSPTAPPAIFLGRSPSEYESDESGNMQQRSVSFLPSISQHSRALHTRVSPYHRYSFDQDQPQSSITSPSYVASEYHHSQIQMGSLPDHFSERSGSSPLTPHFTYRQFQDKTRVEYAQHHRQLDRAHISRESALAGWDGTISGGGFSYQSRSQWARDNTDEHNTFGAGGDLQGASGSSGFMSQYSMHPVPSAVAYMALVAEHNVPGSGYNVLVSPDSFDSMQLSYPSCVTTNVDFGPYVMEGDLSPYGSTSMDAQIGSVKLEDSLYNLQLSPPPLSEHSVPTPPTFAPFQPQRSYTLSEAMTLPNPLPPSPTSLPLPSPISPIATPNSMVPVTEDPPERVPSPPMASLLPPSITRRSHGQPRKHPLPAVSLPLPIPLPTSVPPHPAMSTASSPPSPISPLIPMSPQLPLSSGSSGQQFKMEERPKLKVNYPYPVFPTTLSPSTSQSPPPPPLSLGRPGTPRTIPLAESASKPRQLLFKISSVEHTAKQAEGKMAGGADEEEGKPLTIKQVIMACLFCRKRKIACGQPDVPGRKCKQCTRRGLVCKFPKESHRGMHKRGPCATTATRAIAAALPPSSSILSASSGSSILSTSKAISSIFPSIPSAPDSELTKAFIPSLSSPGAGAASPSAASAGGLKKDGSNVRKVDMWDPVAASKRRAVIREERKQKVSMRQDREHVLDERKGHVTTSTTTATVATAVAVDSGWQRFRINE